MNINAGGYKIRHQNGLHFLTMTTVGWVDIFTRQQYRDIILDSFRFCQEKKGMIIYAYVIMSNHIHLIAEVKSERGLSHTLGDLKQFTSKQIIKSIKNNPESRQDWLEVVMKYHAKYNPHNEQYQLWQNGSHPEHLYSPDFIWQKLNCLHQNPVRAGLVTEPSHWLYSSASNYATGNGILDVTILEFPINTIGYVPLIL